MQGFPDHWLPLRVAVRHLSLLVLLWGLIISWPSWAQERSGEVGLPRFPSISPDGSELIFSWRGDLWRVSSEGGEAVRLTRHDLDDLHSSWSPDGEWILFASMRDGYLNLWRMHRDGSQLTQLTYSDQYLRNPAYGLDANGEPVITFSGMLEADVYRDQRPYQLAPEGGEYTRLHDAFGSAPQLSPDGRYVAFTRGAAYHDWNRRHYRGPDALNIWLHELGSEDFEPLTERDGDDGLPRWVDGDTLLFMSDREDQTVNLYRMQLDTERTIERLTHFDVHGVQHFDVSRDGSTVVLQVWDRLMTLDLETPDAEPEPIALRAPDDGRDMHRLHRIDRDISEAALSPDNQTMAYIAYGRVYIRHVDEQSPTLLVTPGTHARHHGLAWSPDGLHLYFINDADGSESIYRADVALTRSEVLRSHQRQQGEARITRHQWQDDTNVSLAAAPLSMTTLASLMQSRKTTLMPTLIWPCAVKSRKIPSLPRILGLFLTRYLSPARAILPTCHPQLRNLRLMWSAFRKRSCRKRHPMTCRKSGIRRAGMMPSSSKSARSWLPPSITTAMFPPRRMGAHWLSAVVAATWSSSIWPAAKRTPCWRVGTASCSGAGHRTAAISPKIGRASCRE